jgi:uncharacterized protein YbjT (DUF2867 family)
MKRILVIGGTGTVGRQVVAQLPATGVRVRALVRNPDTAGLPAHVDVVRGDLCVPETLDAALGGVDTVFLVWCAPATAVAAGLERIASRVQRIVFLSSPYKTAHPFFQGGQPNPVATMHAEIERIIETSGREWTFVRPGMFSANTQGWWGPRIRAGDDVIRWPYAGVATAPIDERDIAAVAVRALLDHGHAGAEYVLTGTESITQAEQVWIIGDVIGRRLRMEDISPDEARRELSMFPAYIVNYLLRAWGAAAGHDALVTSTVSEITGAPARSFRQWTTDHARLFQA